MERKAWWQTPGTLPNNKKVTLQSQAGPVGKNWWTRQFVLALEDFGDDDRLNRAKYCARNGFGNYIRLGPGEVSMGICCSGKKTRIVGFIFPRFSEEVWDSIIGIIAGDAALTGSLLAGEFTRDLVNVLEEKEVCIIPDQYRRVRAYCPCADSHNPCIHTGAAWYFLAEILDEDPWMLFLLHGMTKEEMICRVQSLRDLNSRPVHVPETKWAVTKPVDDISPSDPQWFFSCTGNDGKVPGPVPGQKVSPILLLGPAAYRLGGKNLAERISGLYPPVSSYAESLLQEIKEKQLPRKSP